MVATVCNKAFGCCPDPGESGTIQQTSQASSAKRSNFFGNHLSEIAAATLSCTCPATSASPDPVEAADPDNPSEAVGDPGRRGHQNYPRRRRRGGVRTRGQSSGSGTSSRRRVTSTASSASPSCWALDELLVLRDVSIPLGTPCPAPFGYQKALPANTRTLPDLCCQTQFAHSGGHADGYGSHSLQQRSIHVWGTASPGQHADACPRALMSPMLETRRWQATDSTNVCDAGSCSLLVAREKFFPETCGYQSQQNWGWRVAGAWALSSWSCCAVAPGLRNFFRCERDSWCHQPHRSRIRGPSSLRHEKMDNARKPILRILDFRSCH